MSYDFCILYSKNLRTYLPSQDALSSYEDGKVIEERFFIFSESHINVQVNLNLKYRIQRFLFQYLSIRVDKHIKNDCLVFEKNRDL